MDWIKSLEFRNVGGDQSNARECPSATPAEEKSRLGQTMGRAQRWMAKSCPHDAVYFDIGLGQPYGRVG
jgi:hypothetical protein